ncbi:LysR family transcriptional regulator [Acinetobacter qingfengensis]|uniref:HTH lysR-type domain-containing protein n=1 Tax=Acinetobacter qingfengensis TaxID=1262585 RepID=A0A1E7QWF7_9GAMM|nr:LysR family transcriptional regulator [Acinetobacter qingfengensis]KAA8731312.1 LysR family transcriptional regulator [Acinetobacter qingfengensis]OEY91442.1 hypothetical protein BJI46_06810 [Acinetobacter qingfengensis]
MKIEDIEAFVAFVELQSTTLAADKLNVSQPSVSKRIQNLEDDLGLDLFDRRSRPLKLTQQGVAIYQQSQQILQQLLQFKSLAGALKSENKKIRLGIATSIADICLLHLLDYMKLHYPHIQLEIFTGWSVDLMQRFKLQQLDLVILTSSHFSKIDSSIVTTLIAPLNIVPVVSRLLQSSSIQSIEDCQQIGWILNHEGCGYRAYLSDYLVQHNLIPNIKIEITGTRNHAELLTKGLGVGLMPKQVVESSLYAQQLTVIEPDFFSFEVMLFAAIQPDLANIYAALLTELSQQVRKILGLP